MKTIAPILLIAACTSTATIKAPGETTPCYDGYTRVDAGCVPLDDTAEPGGSDSGSDSEDTGGPLVSLPADCSPPSPLPADPISNLGEHDSIPTTPGPPELLIELVEVVVDQDLALGVGQGGLIIYDIADPLSPEILGTYPDRGHGRFHRLHVFEAEDPGRGLAYLTHRDHGLSIVDVSDPTDIVEAGLWGRDGLGGMSQQGDLLYITQDEGNLLTLDITDRSAFVELGSVSGLGHPWTLVSTPEALYIADGSAGVVVMSLADPRSPAVVDTIDLGGVQDLVLGAGILYAAAGSEGLVALDLSDPLHPVEVDRVDYGTSMQGIARDGEVLWAVDQERVVAVDISTPGILKPIGSRTTPQFSMDVAASDGMAWVADWGRLGGYAVDAAIASPDISLALSELLINTEGDEVRVQLHNRGQADLSLAGVDVGAPGFSVAVTADTLAPGERAELHVTWEGGEVQTELCIASDDPDEPVVAVTLHTGGGGTVPSVGLPAPDFVLIDLEGHSHRLSEHLGHPVVLVYFATW
jgi:hypothetical protein